MDCVILAGGKGSRMEYPEPKPLVLVGGKPIIAHQLDYLKGVFDNIVLALGYKAWKIQKYVNENYEQSNITFSVEKEPLGTAGGLKKALEKVNSENVLVINCDDITNINLEKILKINENTICVAHPVLPFGLVSSYCGWAEFIEKPTLNCWVSCGWYVLKKRIKNILPEKGSLEYDVFQSVKPATFDEPKLRIFYHEGFWHPLSTRKDVEEFEKIYPK